MYATFPSTNGLPPSSTYVYTVQLDLNLKLQANHMRVFGNSCRAFLKIRVCRHLHKKFACTACTVITLIAMINSKLHHMSVLDMHTYIMHTKTI